MRLLSNSMLTLLLLGSVGVINMRESGTLVTPGQPVQCDSAFLQRPQVNPPLSNEPQLQQPKEAMAQVAREYQDLRGAASAGPRLWILVDTHGRVVNAVLHRSSGDIRTDSAALRAVRGFEFAPAEYKGSPHCAWLNVPMPPPPTRPDTGGDLFLQTGESS
ncbi:MAG: energy transducer TonB [Phycisphaerales bacterium]